MSEETVFGTPAQAPEAPAPFQEKKKDTMPIALRILLVCASVLLCICLFCTALATVVVLDLNVINSTSTYRQVVNEVLYTPLPTPERLSEEPGDTESLVSQLIYDAIKSQGDESLDFTQEDVDAFVRDASISDYLKDKAVSYVEDFVNGTQNTEITQQELEQLIDDNKDLIEQTFDVELDTELRQEILTYVEENDVNEIVQTQIIEEAEKLPIAGESFTLGKLMDLLRPLFSPMTVTLLIFLCLLLMVGLFFTNRMHLGGTLICAGIPVLFVGVLTVVLLTAVQSLLLVAANIPVLGNVVVVLAEAIAPVHYIVLALGAVLLIAGIVVKCVVKPKTAKA